MIKEMYRDKITNNSVVLEILDKKLRDIIITIFQLRTSLIY